jgi:hypothetical protein
LKKITDKDEEKNVRPVSYLYTRFFLKKSNKLFEERKAIYNITGSSKKFRFLRYLLKYYIADGYELADKVK